MRKCDVVTPGQALAYITDCTLATVAYMAGLKRKSKYEYKRQIAIAQVAVDWMQSMDIDYGNTRAEIVVNIGSVEKWAEAIEEATIY